MSKKDVIKPGHFKLSGKLRAGQDTPAGLNKEAYSEEKARETAGGAKPVPGAREARTRKRAKHR
jgi:hypothetical protein